MLHETLKFTAPTPLLRVWAKTTLAGCPWGDAMVAAASVSTFFRSGSPRGIDILDVEFITPRFTVYRAVCERLEAIERITDATECFCGMANELAREIQDKEWVLGQ